MPLFSAFLKLKADKSGMEILKKMFVLFIIWNYVGKIKRGKEANRCWRCQNCTAKIIKFDKKGKNRKQSQKCLLTNTKLGVLLDKKQKQTFLQKIKHISN